MQSSSYLYALDPDGNLKWKHQHGVGFGISPAISADGTIYIGGGFLYAFDPNGTIKSKGSNPVNRQGDYISAIESFYSPAIGPDGTIYVANSSHKGKWLSAFSPDGDFKWSYEVGDYFYSSPAVSSYGIIYFGSADDYFYAINPDGTLKWKYHVGNNIDSSAAIGADGTIYFGGCSDSKIYALSPDGSLKWEYDTGENWAGIYSSPAIGADGTVYIGGPSCVYAFGIPDEVSPQIVTSDTDKKGGLCFIESTRF